MTFKYISRIPVMHPVIDSVNRKYWNALKRHELVIQRCNNCGKQVHPPRPMCPRCLSTDRGWKRLSGEGTIYTWVNCVYDKAAYPGIEVPYAVVVVEMEDCGARILSNVIDVNPAKIYIGMPVKAVFTDIDDVLTLVHFKKREA